MKLVRIGNILAVLVSLILTIYMREVMQLPENWRTYAFIGCIVLIIYLFYCLKTRKKDISSVKEELSRAKKVIREKDGLIDSLHDELEETVKAREYAENKIVEHRKNLRSVLQSNLSAAPWLAGMMADFITYDLEVEAKKLDWGSNIQRMKKVASIRDIRAHALDKITKAKEAEYQLEYLRTLFPAVDDILQTDYKELEQYESIPDYDPVRKYLSNEEWQKLSDCEKNQLALDRYIESRKKSKWQIGRDYELSVAYEYREKGYKVDTFGSYMGLEDLGRDLIATKDGVTLVVQCKYWSQRKEIHEKHIFQLYGTAVSYCIEHDISPHDVKPVFVTNITLSNTAKRVAEYLGIAYSENHNAVNFPRIKCNIGRDESGITHIYHLPMDGQYDTTQIKNPGEFYAFTVAEAENAGFRRAFKWHG